MFKGEQRTTDLNNAVCSEARHAAVEAHVHLLPRHPSEPSHHFLYRMTQSRDILVRVMTHDTSTRKKRLQTRPENGFVDFFGQVDWGFLRYHQLHHKSH